MWWKKFLMNRFVKIRQNIERGFLMGLLFLSTVAMSQKVNCTKDPLWEEALSIHEEALVVDAHAHRLVFGPADRASYHPEASQMEVSMVKKGGVDAIALYFAYYPIENGTLYQRVKKDLGILEQRI